MLLLNARTGSIKSRQSSNPFAPSFPRRLTDLAASHCSILEHRVFPPSLPYHRPSSYGYIRRQNHSPKSVYQSRWRSLSISSVYSFWSDTHVLQRKVSPLGAWGLSTSRSGVCISERYERVHVLWKKLLQPEIQKISE